MYKIGLLGLWLLLITRVTVAQPALPELSVEEIAKGIYLHTSYKHVSGWGLVASNGLVVLNHNAAYIIDTPISVRDTKALVSWIQAQGAMPKGSVSTHFHDDSAGGIGYLNSINIPTYASALTNQLIAEDGREPAKFSFELNDASRNHWWIEDTIEVFYPGAGHTKDNIAVWLPTEHVLFGGCFVKPKSLGYLGDALVAQWPSSASQLLSRYESVKMVVPGHGNVGDRSLLTKTHTLAKKAAALQPSAPSMTNVTND